MWRHGIFWTPRKIHLEQPRVKLQKKPCGRNSGRKPERGYHWVNIKKALREILEKIIKKIFGKFWLRPRKKFNLENPRKALETITREILLKNTLRNFGKYSWRKDFLGKALAKLLKKKSLRAIPEKYLGETFEYKLWGKRRRNTK